MKFVFALPDGRTTEIDVLYDKEGTAVEVQLVNDRLTKLKQPIAMEELVDIHTRLVSESQDALKQSFLKSTNAVLKKKFSFSEGDRESLDDLSLIPVRTINQVKTQLERMMLQRPNSSRGERSVSFSETPTVRMFARCDSSEENSEENSVFTPLPSSTPQPLEKANSVARGSRNSLYPPLVSPETKRKYNDIIAKGAIRSKSVTPYFFPAQEGSKLPARSASAMLFGGPKK